MEFKKSENGNGLSVEIMDLRNDDTIEYTPFMGGDSRNPNWKEYIEDFKEEFKDHVRLIKKCIEENGLIGSTGQDADTWVFKFSDGETWGYTWRAWGDLMQAIVNKKEGYMAYYM